MAAQIKVTIRGKEWNVTLATAPEELAQGLGGIPELAPGTGMLFDVGFAQTIQVTTAPMLFPLDIAFLSDTLVITEVYRNVQPGYLVTSEHPARYFLEVNAGELEGVDSGDRATVELLAPSGIMAAPDWTSALVSFMGFLIIGIFTVGIVKGLVKGMLEEQTADPEINVREIGPGAEKLLPQTVETPAAKLRREEILHLHHMGLSPTEIALILGIHRTLAAQRIREAGLKPVMAPRFREAELRMGEVIRLHDEGLTAKEIAKKVGMSLEMIYLRLREAELEPRIAPEEKRLAQSQAEMIGSLAKWGMPCYKIVRATGVRWPLISEILDKRGIKHPVRASEDLATWATELLPLIREIRRAHPDTVPIVAKVDQLERELTAIAEATHVELGKLPFHDGETELERWALGELSGLVQDALWVMSALKHCLRMLDMPPQELVKWPHAIEQAEQCIMKASSFIIAATKPKLPTIPAKPPEMYYAETTQKLKL